MECPNTACLVIKYIVLAYLLFIAFYTFIRFMFTNRKTFSVVLAGLTMMGLLILVYFVYVPASSTTFRQVLRYIIVIVIPVSVIAILAPDIRAKFETNWSTEGSKITGIKASSEKTKENIIEAVMELSNRKIGALITLENHNTLDQFADSAIQINGAVTKELLMNIFVPLTPLHDGAVIIRGDEVVCAGAYYTLSTNDTFEKTMGSRHRAALGISEITDSLTIVVSEETGDISIAVSSMLIKITSRDKLVEYLNLYIK